MMIHQKEIARRCTEDDAENERSRRRARVCPSLSLSSLLTVTRQVAM